MPYESPGRRRAKERAESLLDELGIEGAPAHRLKEVANGVGVRVEEKPLEADTSGVLVRRGDKAAIAVNENHAETRRHFTIAHELGHWVLHSESDGVHIDEVTVHFRDPRSSEGYDPKESEANAFAAALLMPEGLLRQELSDRLIDASDDEELEKFAERFGVSREALTIRLTNLDLLAF